VNWTSPKALCEAHDVGKHKRNRSHNNNFLKCFQEIRTTPGHASTGNRKTEGLTLFSGRLEAARCRFQVCHGMSLRRRPLT